MKKYSAKGLMGDPLTVFSALDDITPDQIEELENKFADYVRGYVGDDVLEFMRDIEVPEMSGLCDSE